MNLIDQHPDWIIYEVVSGSQAYGLATPESDVDLRGVFIPSKEYFLSPFKYVEQCESKNPDRTLFEIRKFVKLATDNNPNILELLFIDEQHIQKITKEGEQLRSIRNEFLSAKCKFTYSGYAMSQLKRIKTHKKWLIHPRETQPKREEFGLFYKIFTEEEFGYLKALMEMDNTKGNPIVMSSQFPSGVIELFNKEREYRNALADYNSYQTWKKQRNPKRAELEAKFGYDIKHAKHLVRLMLQGEEILLQGTLTVDVSNRPEVIEVGNGLWGFDQLLDWASAQDNKLEEIYQKQTYVVPHHINVQKIEAVVMEMITARLRIEIMDDWGTLFSPPLS